VSYKHINMGLEEDPSQNIQIDVTFVGMPTTQL
jgi:hypothetical protein